jgi:hypothetical protein
MQIDWRQVMHVAGAGALGGLLCWIYSEAIETPLGLGWLGSPVASACLGMGAAVLGVYLIAKTDMNATLHALAFAMACGFSWRPVLEGAGALVEAQVAQATEAAIDESTEEAVASSESLRAQGGDDGTDELAAAVTRSIDALRHDPRRTTVAEERSLRLEDVVQNIKTASGLSVGERIEGIRKIGSAATAAGDQSLAAISMSAIAELGDGASATPDKEKAAAAVAEIGDKASFRRMPSLQVNSDVIKEGIRADGAAPVKDIFDRRFGRPPLHR